MKDVWTVYVNDSNEFEKNLTDYLNTNNILNGCIIGNKRKTSPIERFNRILRLYLQNYRVVKGKIDSLEFLELSTARSFKNTHQ